MKFLLAFSLLMACSCCCFALRQQTPSPATEQDRRTIRQIDRLQHEIERLESQIAARQKTIDTLVNQLSVAAQSEVPFLHPKVAMVLSINGQVIIVNAGIKGNGLRVGDKVLFARRTQAGIVLMGKGTIFRAYATDAEGDVTEDNGVRPEDEVYVCSRSGSPYSISRIQLNPDKK